MPNSTPISLDTDSQISLIDSFTHRFHPQHGRVSKVNLRSRNGVTCMCTDNSRAFTRFPFPSYSKSNETASIATHEILLAALDFVVPGFTFGKFSEPSF